MAEEAPEAQTTLRETIEQAVEQHVPESAPAPSASPSAEATPPSEPSPATPASERARDDKGRFVEKKDEPAAAQAQPAIAPAAPQVPAKPLPARPSSWKKDYEADWAKLDPRLAEYILQREGEYAKGVSTYKQEWESAKPLLEALNPFKESIQSLGLQPAQFVSNLANAHQTLSRGTPEQRLSMFMKLAQDYQVPVQSMFVQGQDGKVYFNPQVQAYQAQQGPAQPQGLTPEQVRKLVREEQAATFGQQQIEQFAQAKDSQGNPAHPYFEKVKAKMALLLDAGEAQDLQDAYRKAIRMDDELWQSEQESQRKADEAARQEAQRKAVAAAKANVVSPKSATPAAQGGNKGNKGLRAQLEDAFDQHTASRV